MDHVVAQPKTYPNRTPYRNADAVGRPRTARSNGTRANQPHADQSNGGSASAFRTAPNRIAAIRTRVARPPDYFRLLLGAGVEVSTRRNGGVGPGCGFSPFASVPEIATTR